LENDMRVFAPTPFRFQGADYPYGYQDVADSLGDTLRTLGLVLGTAPNALLTPAQLAAVNADSSGKAGPVIADIGGILRDRKGGVPGLRKSRGARLMSGSMFATAATVAGTTWHTTIALPAPFTHVAPVFLNLETGAITISKCAVAAVTGLLDSSSHCWPNATYANVTFGGATAGVMAARAAANQPTPFVADMTPLQSVAATDGSGMYYLAVRTYFDAAGGGSGSGTGYSYVGEQASPDGFASLFGGQVCRTSTQAVDGVGTPTAMTNGAATANQVLAGVIYWCEGGLPLTVACVGDSTVRGLNGSSGVAGGFVRAAGALSVASRPISCVNIGCSGATPIIYSSERRGLRPGNRGGSPDSSSSHFAPAGTNTE
jgi:hypothetical protein